VLLRSVVAEKVEARAIVCQLSHSIDYPTETHMKCPDRSGRRRDWRRHSDEPDPEGSADPLHSKASRLGRLEPGRGTL
jgi:hypothetical protein